MEKLQSSPALGSGIGRYTALTFAEEGADMVLVGRRVAPLEEVASEVERLGRKAVVHSVDLEDGDAAAAVTDVALANFGKVDILVNNAGHSSKVRIDALHRTGRMGIASSKSMWKLSIASPKPQSEIW